jgi:hypothetical protein
MIIATPSAPSIANTGEAIAAIASASRKTGSDFTYLLATAKRESNLDSTAKSKSSSASGLFQFIEQTWLSVIKRFGTRHGLSQFADAISETGSGRYVVGSVEAKSAILALREDAKISALMAGEAAAATKQSLAYALGREVLPGELYAAHFFGERGARRLIELNAQDPGARADWAFPEAAEANRSVFYHRDGDAKTIGEVHAWAVTEPSPKHDRVIVGTAGGANRRTAASRELVVYASRDVISRASGLPLSPLVLNSSVLEILSGAAEAERQRHQ